MTEITTLYKTISFNTDNKKASEFVIQELINDLRPIYKFYVDKEKVIQYTPEVSIIDNDTVIDFTITYNGSISIVGKSIVDKQTIKNEISISSKDLKLAAAFSGTLKAILFINKYNYKEVSCNPTSSTIH